MAPVARRRRPLERSRDRSTITGGDCTSKVGDVGLNEGGRPRGENLWVPLFRRSRVWQRLRELLLDLAELAFGKLEASGRGCATEELKAARDLGHRGSVADDRR